MKSFQLFFFISLVSVVYFFVNYYIYIRGLQALQGVSQYKIYYKVLFILLASSYILARILERSVPSLFSEVLTWIGSFWLAAMLYFFLTVLLLDLFRLINYFFPFYPDIIIANYSLVRQYIFFGSISCVILVIIYGYYNTTNTVIKKTEITINKKAGGFKQLNIVAVSDIHLGTIIGNRKFQSIVEKVNSLKPDIIILAGDVIDEDVNAVIRKDIGRSLHKLQSVYGIYAVTGNHEYIGGAEKACKYLTDHNIIVLRDTFKWVDSSFYIIGREDKEKLRFSGRERKKLLEIIKGLDPELPKILIDHQPYHLEEAQMNDIDLQISGHTHHGQLFPFNLITRMIFEVSRGYKQKGTTHYYVSSGAGTWGPPVRIGSQAEIIQLILHFKEN